MLATSSFTEYLRHRSRLTSITCHVNYPLPAAWKRLQPEKRQEPREPKTWCRRHGIRESRVDLPLGESWDGSQIDSIPLCRRRSAQLPAQRLKKCILFLLLRASRSAVGFTVAISLDFRLISS